MDLEHELIVGDSYQELLERQFVEWTRGNIFITIVTYRRMLSLENPTDAVALYSHLIFTARLQKTNQVWANDTYLRNGLKWGWKRLKHAKADLSRLGLIDYIQRRDHSTQRYKKTYIRINYIVNKNKLGSSSMPESSSRTSPRAGGTFAAPSASRPTGSETQMLQEKNKMLIESSNELSDCQKTSNGSQPLGKSRENKQAEQIRKVVKDIANVMSLSVEDRVLEDRSGDQFFFNEEANKYEEYVYG
jgi:hypothetical protein